ncbi:MAG: transporter substrate-binding domain-containing protein [Clostridia bacterium]|nr:transporter substrate-binding domain-containing protein [Clostridia bacterium]
MKKTMKLMALVLALATLFALMAGCSGGEKKDVIVLGTSADYPPFESMALNSDLEGKYDEIVVANGKEPNSYYGIDIAMAKAIAKKMGKELQIVNMSFDNLITALGKGEIDFVIAAMEKDGEREKGATPSDPYYTDLPAMIVVKKENLSKYTTMADFSGKTVGAQSGTTKLDVVTDVMTGAQSKALASVTDLINEVIYDKVDAVVLDGAVAKKYAAANDKLAIVEAVSLGDAAAPFHVWVQKDDPKSLLGDINAAIKDVVDGGKIGTWYELADELGDKSLF